MAARTAKTVPGLRLQEVAGLDEWRDEWSRLAAQSGNIFSTWEWAHTWWRHHGGGRVMRLLLCLGESDAPVAVLPLYEAFGRPVRVLRFIGHGAADELGPVCAPGTPGVGAALASAPEMLGCDVLLADRLSTGDAGWAERSGPGVTMTRESSPSIDIAGLTWEEYLAGRSSNFRSQVRRKERKLVRESGLTYRLSDDPDRLQADLEVLFELHSARWGAAGSGALQGPRAAFHREFATLAQEKGWLRLWLAEADGQPIAAWYGFRFGGADWYYQFGRDPAWDKSSVGLVLLAHTIRDALSSGQRQYRLLRGGESYKARFATCDPGLATVAYAVTTRGRLVVESARRGLSLPGPLRRRLTRLVG